MGYSDCVCLRISLVVRSSLRRSHRAQPRNRAPVLAVTVHNITQTHARRALPDAAQAAATGGGEARREGFGLQQLLPAGLAALLHEPLHLLRAGAGGDQQGIGHVNDNQIVHTEKGYEPA